MRQVTPWLLALSLYTGVLLSASTAAAVPKLDVKIFIGVGSVIFVPRAEGLRKPDAHLAWRGGLGGRLRIKRFFAEVLLSFNRFQFTVAEDLFTDEELMEVDPALLGQGGTMNSFALPLMAGYVATKTPLFKLYLYGGLVNHFNIGGFVDLPNGERERFSPGEVHLAIYNAGARMGVEADLAMFNFDLSYTIGMNSATATDVRTNVHNFQFNLGYLF